MIFGVSNGRQHFTSASHKLIRMPVVVEGFDMKIVFLLERAAIKAGTTFSYRWEGRRKEMFNV